MQQLVYPLLLPLLFLLIYFFVLEQRFLSRHADFTVPYRTPETNMLHHASGAARARTPEATGRTRLLSYVRARRADYGTLKGFVRVPYPIALQHPHYLGTRHEQFAYRILLYPFMLKITALVTMIVADFAFYFGVQAYLENASTGEKLLITLFSDIAREAITSLHATVRDAFAYFALPVLDLMPLLFGGAFSTQPWVWHSPFGLLEMNKYAVAVYYGMLILLVSPLRFLLGSLAVNVITGVVMLHIALVILFIWTAYDDFALRYSFRASIDRFRQIHAASSYLDWIVAPSSLNSIAQTIEQAVRVIVANGKWPMTIFWIVIGEFIFKRLQSAHAAPRIGAMIREPDFLEEHLVAEEEKASQDLDIQAASIAGVSPTDPAESTVTVPRVPAGRAGRFKPKKPAFQPRRPPRVLRRVPDEDKPRKRSVRRTRRVSAAWRPYSSGSRSGS